MTLSSISSKLPLVYSRRFIKRWIPPTSCHDTNIKIYNCVAKEKVPLITRKKNLVTWYTCGPTVYATSHIGHASCYTRLDIIQNILRNYFNLNLITIMNITDIDDKIINKTINSSTTWRFLARKYETEFFQDLKSLKITKPDLVCRVTEFMPQIIDFIDKLITNQRAYVASDGSVYFALDKYNNYGKLEKVGESNRDKSDELKRSRDDFALWKSAKENEPFWTAKWGNGRPGWHIECSAIASLFFGEQIDIHAGGIDLRFPHHENEEAQSCSYHNCDQWINYWIHTGHLHLKNSEKMSKSLGNTISIASLLENYSAYEFRMSCLITHYRNHMEFTIDFMKNARAILEKFQGFFEFSQDPSLSLTRTNREVLEQEFDTTVQTVDEALKDDFDTPLVISSLLKLIQKTYSLTKSSETSEEMHSNIDIILGIRSYIKHILNSFGIDLGQHQATSDIQTENIVSHAIDFRSKVRMLAKANKDTELFKLCDSFRQNLFEEGIEIKDSDQRVKWINKKKN